MWELLLRYFSVYSISTLKFVGGPVIGVATGLNIFETVILTVAGMMTSVFCLSYFGDFFQEKFRSIFPNKKKWIENDKIAAIWDKYGIKGIAFLTPVIFSPMVGTIMALSLGGKRHNVLIYMFISAGFWAIVQSVVLHYFGDLVNI